MPLDFLLIFVIEMLLKVGILLAQIEGLHSMHCMSHLQATTLDVFGKGRCSCLFLLWTLLIDDVVAC